MAKPIKEFIIGKEYGHLTPIKEVEKDKTGHFQFLARCRCGKEFIANKSVFFRELPMCAECSKKHHLASTIKRYEGQIYNNWEVIKYDKTLSNGIQIYECKCLNCGQISHKSVYAARLNVTGRCQNCPPTYNFIINGSSATGVLPDGTAFIIDADKVPEFSKYNWIKNSKGYIQRSNKNMPKLMLHWFALGYDKAQEFLIDHKNRNRLDNRSSNLRLVTCEQNSMNRSLSKNNTTGYLGVCQNKKKNGYISKIMFHNKNFFLCHNTDLVTAAQMYNYAADLIFGEFKGHHNDVPEASPEIKRVVEEKIKSILPVAWVDQLPVTSKLYIEMKALQIQVAV